MTPVYMIPIYAALVRAQRRTLDQVPEDIREAVEAKLNET